MPSLCPVTSDLNRHLDAEDKAIQALEDTLKRQRAKGIDSIRAYSHDITESKDQLDDVAATLDSSGALPHLIYLARTQTELASIYLQRLARVCIEDRARQIDIEEQGVYEPIERDMRVGKSADALEKCITEIKNK